MPPENIDAQAKVTANTRVPICTGENLYRKHGYRDLIEKQAADIIAPDIPKMGGLMEARKVADMADTYYINVAPHNVSSPIGTVAAAHVCASIPNFLVIEFHAHDVPWWGDLVDGEPPIKRRIHLSWRWAGARDDAERGCSTGASEARVVVLWRHTVAAARLETFWHVPTSAIH